MARIITILGYLLLVVGVGFILIGWAGVLMTDGFLALLEMLNPFNVVNFIAQILTLAPGLLLIYWGGALKDRH